MQENNSPLFGPIPQPDSFSEFIDLVTELADEGRGRVRLWRGHADLSWRLDSSAVRRLAAHKDVKLPLTAERVEHVERQLVDYETHLLQRAEFHGYRFHEGRSLSDLELLARLRHYGAATRLLDTSRSALVALWFAVSSLPDTHGAVFGVHCHYLGGGEGDPLNESYSQMTKGLLGIDHPITCASTAISPRVAAQHSQFLYSGAGSGKQGSIRVAGDSGALLAIAITPHLKFEAADILRETFDIHHFTIFPDLEGFAAGNAEWRERWNMERW